MKTTSIVLTLICAFICTPTGLRAQATEMQIFEFPKWLVHGSKIPRKIEREKRGESELVALVDGNYFYALYPIRSHGMEAKVLAYNSDRKRRIRGILITDEGCETPEGIKPGAKYEEIKNLAPGTPEPHYGWGHFWKLPSGWIVMFTEGATEIEPVTNESEVYSLFAYGDDPPFDSLKLMKSTKPDKAVDITAISAPR